MNAQGEVLQTIRWNQVDETRELLTRLGALRAAGVVVEVAVEPTATYADAVVAQLLAQGVAVYRINTKHSHDYQEIYDGVPSGHDAKAAAIVAKLHLERGGASRRWPVPTAQRRELRMRVAALDWIKQDEQRALSRLESRLARHGPELLQLLPLTGVTAVKLLATYGSPAAVAADPDGAVAALRQWARGQLSADTRARVVASAKATLGIQPFQRHSNVVRRFLRGQQMVGRRVGALLLPSRGHSPSWATSRPALRMASAALKIRWHDRSGISWPHSQC